MKLLVTLLVLFPQAAEALSLDSPLLCFLLDGILGIYGLIVTGMLIKEKFYKKKNKDIASGDNKQSKDAGQRRQNRQARDDSTYAGLRPGGVEEYNELSIKPERQRRDHQVYEGPRGIRDQYEALRRKPLQSP